MRKIADMIKKHGITVWLVVSVLLLASFISYAEYIEEQNRIKRVVANTAETGQMFASDYLEINNLTPRKISSFSTENSCEIPIKIWNYNPNDPVNFYQKKMDYVLTAQLVNTAGERISKEALGDRMIGIQKEDGSYNYFSEENYTDENGYMITLENSYAGTAKETHNYKLQFSKEMLTDKSDIYVKMIATPNQSVHRELYPISAILGVTEANKVLTQGWSGDFSDSAVNTDYDGYNFIISGNGAATIKFGWRTDKFEANKFFLEDIKEDIAKTVNETIEGVEWRFIYINADSNDTIINDEVTRYGNGRYDIQLYVTGNADSDYSSWETIKGYVEFDPDASVPTD